MKGCGGRRYAGWVRGGLAWAFIAAVVPAPGEAARKEEPARMKPEAHWSPVPESALVGSGWQFAGTIVGARDQENRSLLTLGDTVYLDAGRKQGLMARSRYGIFRKGPAFKDSRSGALLGYEVKRVGTVEISPGVDEGSASGTIREAADIIRIGDLIRKEEEWVQPRAR